MNEIFEALKSINGVKDLKPYTLVNNYGCDFTIKGKRYDVRRWVNMYGVDLQYGISDGSVNITDLTLNQILRVIHIILN